MFDPERFEQLSAYLDGELTPAQKREVEQWLHNHPEARRQYQHLMQFSDQFRQTPVPTTTVNLDTVVLQAQGQMYRTWGSVGTLMVAVSGILLWFSAVETPQTASIGGLPRMQFSQYLLEDEAPVDPYVILLNNVQVADK